MKKTFTLFAAMILAVMAFAQNADFENFNLGVDEFLNGSDGSGGFQSGKFYFPNQFTDGGTYTYWNGWSVSSMTDNMTPGVPNEYSSITGGGADGSDSYAVSFVVGHSVVRFPDNDFEFAFSIQVTNSTYAYYSMLEGDSYAKKFGGADGNDPDFFMLTIKGYSNGAIIDDSIDFYLADYRFDDNSQDYIVDEWVTINLHDKFFNADSLIFTLSSSDVAPWGINTPAYFCLDNMIYDWIHSDNANEQVDYELQIMPNPVVDYLSIDWKENLEAGVFIYAANGQLLKKEPLAYGLQTIDVQALPAGMYFLKILTEEGWVSERFVKE